jgi:hypothetical protein
LLDALLFTVNVPVAAPAAVGANFTLSVNVCCGFNVTGKLAPDTVKPVPLIAAELIVNAEVPLEVIVTGSVALDPVPTLPKLNAVELMVHCGVPVPVPLRLTEAVALLDALLFTVNVPVTAPAVAGADFTLSVTVCCGLRVSGKEAPLTLNPAPLIVAELIVTAAVPVELNVSGKVELEPTVTLPKFRLLGLTVNCGVDADPVAVAEKVAICMTQGPAYGVTGAVAL